MPSYGGITILLQSQYEALPIPEYAPPAPVTPPSTSAAPLSSDCRSFTTSLTSSKGSTLRSLESILLHAPPPSCASSSGSVMSGAHSLRSANSNPSVASPSEREASKSSLFSKSSTLRYFCSGPSVLSEAPSMHPSVESFVPIYYGAQFWVHYDCLMAHHPTPEAFEDGVNDDVKYYYFKGFVGGRCVLSWGVGEKDGWRGKVSFGIFDGGTDLEGNNTIERRAFFFPRNHKGCEDVHDGQFDIRVYRSKARKKEPLALHKYDEGGSKGGGFSVLNAGRVRRSDPMRMYTYALLDPVNEPYATFRYHLRSTSQLTKMGIDLSTQDASVFASSPPQSTKLHSPASSPQLSPPAPVIPRDQLSSYRLSFPPRMQLTASTSTISHGSPMKRNAFHNAQLERFDYENMMHSSAEEHVPRNLDEALESLDDLNMVDQFVKVHDLQEPHTAHGRFDSVNMMDRKFYNSLPATIIPDWVMSKPLPARPDERSHVDKTAGEDKGGALASFKGFMGSRSKR